MALRTLYQTLLDSDLARLHVIALQWNITLVAERKPDVAAELADAMARAKAVEHAVAGLDDAARAALDDLLRLGGVMPWAIFTRRRGELRAVGPGRLEREELWRTPVSPVEQLWYLGLVQRAFATWPNGQVEMAFVPEELSLYMPIPAPLGVAPPKSAAPPTHQASGTDVLADDLVTLFAALQMETLSPVATSERTTWMRLPQASALLETLALEQGWLQRDERESLRPVAEPMLAWLQADGWSQWATLARAWMESARWNDLAAIPTLRPDPVREWPADPRAARQAFLDLLRHCAPESWYTFVEFTAFVREQNMDFLRPDGDYDVWALRDATTDKPLRGIETWDVVEGAWIAFVLTGPLHWLGMIDLDNEPATCFRLSAAGAALLTPGGPPVLPEPPPLRLSDDGVIAVPLRRRYARFQVRRIARPLACGEDYRYRLTPASLTLARQQRIPLARILAFLEEATGQALPAHLRAAIESAYRGAEPVRLEQVWLLRSPDPALLEHPTLRRFIRESLGEGVALIHASDRDHVLAALARSGVLPELDIA